MNFRLACDTKGGGLEGDILDFKEKIKEKEEEKE